MLLRRTHDSGATLPELMISVLLLGAFFASIYEVNAVCLRYIGASKENVAAIQGVQDRLETLRNLTYTNLVDKNFLKNNVLASTANSSDFMKNVTETITVKAYDTDNNPGGPTGSGIVVQKVPGGAADFVGTPDPNVASAATVLVEVQYDWRMTFGQRARTERTASIVTNGVKK
jgi:Tfp pilus assembly protein PilV